MVVIEKVTAAVNLKNFHLLGPVPLFRKSPMIYGQSALCSTVAVMAVKQKRRREEA